MSKNQLNWLEEKEKVRDLALNQVGMDLVGFTTADDFSYMQKSLYEQKAAGHTSGFEHPVIDERLYPKRLLASGQSIVSFALAYPNQPLYEKKRERGVRRGQFARASWGVDYHHLLREKMDQLIACLAERYEGFEAYGMVDTGELSDVAVARRAGLGFIGRNGLLINQKYGSYIYLGEIITNLPFDNDPIIADGCGECRRCIDFCPTGALLGDGRMNAKRCISYLTQTKGYIPREFRDQVGHQIYGCDICQQVCPYNQGIDSHIHPLMEPERDQVEPILQPMLTMSNKQFKEQFGHLAGAWRGKKPLQRNAILALANYRDRSAIPLLLEIIDQDMRPMIRGTAAYAVAKIEKRYNQALVDFISQAYDQECRRSDSDEETRIEFKLALTTLKEKRK